MPVMSLPEYRRYLGNQADDVNKVRSRAQNAWDGLHKDFSSWPVSGDARLAYFAHVVNQCNTWIMFLSTTFDLLFDPGWQKKRIKTATPNDWRILIEETDRLIRKEIFLTAWATTENAIRRIRTAITGRHATGSIYSHCAALLNTDIRHQRSAEFMALVELVTRTRNASHNNFAYYPDRGSDASVIYRGIEYRFVVGAQLDFLTWEFTQSRVLDEIEMYEEIVRHSKVAGLPTVPSQ